MNKTQKSLLIGSAVILALAGTAIASSYFTRESIAPEKPVAQQARTHTPAPPAQAQLAPAAGQPALPPCDDNNIVGTAGGAVAGALVGNQFGKGSGKTATTLGGMAGGAYLGHEYIPTRGATCR